MDSANSLPMDRPGALRGSATMTIETRQAQRLVYGRSKSESQAPIIGLTRFALTMKRIWTAAMVNDPYADYYLLHVHEAIEDARTLINELNAAIHARLAGIGKKIQIEISHSVEPIKIPLSFANTYGYLGAYLISDYDDLVCGVLTARHMALVTRDEGERAIARGGQAIRRVFFCPSGWKHLAITRDDVRQGNQRAQKATEAMGELPAEVLSAARRAPNAPSIRAASGNACSEQSDLLIL
jgi:integrating conjugative element protein (TIGR03761 family)